MAVISQTLTGAGKHGENIGKNINVQVLSSTNLTQAQLDSVLEQIAQTTTIVSVGPFTAGVTDALGIVTEGDAKVADDSSNAFGISSATWATVTGF